MVAVAYVSAYGYTRRLAEHIRDGLKAVSYTHLDVYKRQVSMLCTGILCSSAKPG